MRKSNGEIETANFLTFSFWVTLKENYIFVKWFRAHKYMAHVRPVNAEGKYGNCFGRKSNKISIRIKLVFLSSSSESFPIHMNMDLTRWRTPKVTPRHARVSLNTLFLSYMVNREIIYAINGRVKRVTQIPHANELLRIAF